MGRSTSECNEAKSKMKHPSDLPTPRFELTPFADSSFYKWKDHISRIFSGPCSGVYLGGVWPYTASLYNTNCSRYCMLSNYNTKLQQEEWEHFEDTPYLNCPPLISIKSQFYFTTGRRIIIVTSCTRIQRWQNFEFSPSRWFKNINRMPW